MKSYRFLFCRMYDLRGLFDDISVVFVSFYACANDSDLEAIIEYNPRVILSRDGIILSILRLDDKCSHKDDDFIFDNNAFLEMKHDAMGFESHIALDNDRDISLSDSVSISCYLMIGFYKEKKEK